MIKNESITVWVSKKDFAWFIEMQSEMRTTSLLVETFRAQTDDLEMVIRPKTEEEKKAEAERFINSDLNF
jgi:hypothetical protein